MEGIRIVPMEDRYAESLSHAPDVVARERRYIGFLEGPPPESTRAHSRAIVEGGGLQLLALTPAA